VIKPVDFAKLLRVNSFFEGLEDATIERLAALCRIRQLAAGETLFVKGDDGDALYGIRRGQIRIETATSSGESLTSSTGKVARPMPSRRRRASFSSCNAPIS
jgi:CRP/FNR family cyclic AMP-dependent transcriptional regulator